MYHTYTMPACVIGGLPKSEADRYLFILTPDYGLIGAQARGVRYTKSKLRSFLQDYSFSDITLVKGKGGWRITNVKPNQSQKEILKKESMSTFVKIASLVRTLSQGESGNRDLFEAVSDAYKILNEETLDNREMFSVECISAIRILKSLGYLPETSELKPFITKPLDKKQIEDFEKIKKTAIATINRSLEASHLS